MPKQWIALTALLLCVVMAVSFSSVLSVNAESLKQIPTGTVPTVTGTVTGVVVSVRLDLDLTQINVRAGPNTTYDKVGVLILGQTAPAKGKSPKGEWILIEYPGAPGGIGWVSADLVNRTPGDLPVVEPPAEPTPRVTFTIDPTLAAQFVITLAPTRLPTYTPPPPLVIPTFSQQSAATGPAGIPIGLVIIALSALGLFIGLFTIAQNR